MKQSALLKASLFATGLSGIVAEYIIATLATYFLGNSVLQWTLILSTMMFSMGVGSRISKYMEKHLLAKFITIEFVLSILVSFCALIAYSASAWSSKSWNPAAANIPFEGVIIYTTSILIGLMIGMEIPMVTRLNEHFESLKVNISNVLENDYYGSLAGGLFFAFVGLPLLGLKYTPFVLGAVNLLVALTLYWQFRPMLESRHRTFLGIAGAVVSVMIVAGAVSANALISYGEQLRYNDRIVLQEQTPYQKLVVTEFKGEYWFYINDHQQLSSFDEHLYHEPMVHVPLAVHPHPQRVLILGGGDGGAARDALKHPEVEQIKLVDLDPRVTEIAREHPAFLRINEGSLNNPKVQVINTDAYTWLEKADEYFDVIIVDFPDPRSIELGRLYSEEFYRMARKHLRPNGLIITQAGSPYFATAAFYSVNKTLEAAGFGVVPMHNQVLTMGEWGWAFGAKDLTAEELKRRILQVDISDIDTRWITNEAIPGLVSFGKGLVKIDSAAIEVNQVHNPVLQRYYNQGNWDIF